MTVEDRENANRSSDRWRGGIRASSISKKMSSTPMRGTATSAKRTADQVVNVVVQLRKLHKRSGDVRPVHGVRVASSNRLHDATTCVYRVGP